MNVIFGDENLKDIQKKHTTLELDTVTMEGLLMPAPTMTMYAVIGRGDLPMKNLVRLKQFIPIHEALIKNYKKQNWTFCIQAIGQLKGNICDFMDTFYANLMDNILKAQSKADKDWNAVIILK